MTDTLADLIAARRGGHVGATLAALDAFIESPAYRVASLRADGVHVYPSGSPRVPGWTVSQLLGAGHAARIGHADSEAAAIELAEATPL